MNLDYEAIAAKVNREAAQMEVDTFLAVYLLYSVTLYFSA